MTALHDTIPTIALNDGRAIPQLGYGTFLIPPPDAAALVEAAIAAGYRSIDTAMVYRNERATGEGIRRSNVARDELFVTTKLWNTDQGYDTTFEAFATSMTLLGLDTLDLYLIHWPATVANGDRYRDSWRAFVELQVSGRVHSIGVSNFGPEHLANVIADTGVTPALNQVELHPYFQQRELVAEHQRLGIVTETWSPLGRGGELLSDPVLVDIAESMGRTTAQIVLRWHVQMGFVTIPKTARIARMRENAELFDFVLSDADMERIAALDRGAEGRIGPDPSRASF